MGRKSYETVTIEFMSRPSPCTVGNETSGVSAAGSIREGLDVKHHLRVEKVRGSLRSYSSMVLSPCMGYPLYRGTNED
jgi:hypothetical protein